MIMRETWDEDRKTEITVTAIYHAEGWSIPAVTGGPPDAWEPSDGDSRTTILEFRYGNHHVTPKDPFLFAQLVALFHGRIDLQDEDGEFEPYRAGQ